MAKRTIWIREEDEEFWQALPNRSDFVRHAITAARSGKMKFKPDKKEQALQEVIAQAVAAEFDKREREAVQ